MLEHMKLELFMVGSRLIYFHPTHQFSNLNTNNLQPVFLRLGSSECLACNKV